jgi:tetratricopeptide (TPR) repeat protein
MKTEGGNPPAKLADVAVVASDSGERRLATYLNSAAVGQEFLAFRCADGRVGRAERGGSVRYFRSILFAGTALCANPAFAADALKFGPPPAWVRAQPIPAAKATQAPLTVLLNDQQTTFEHGKITVFSEGAIQIRNEQGLAAGNLALVWQPATDTVTINKLQIRRGDKIIDVLAAGQTFTILRRETNLDAATLDGTLTGTLQPEGLQVGDIIDFATTVERSDPVLKGHVENMFAAWDGVPIQDAHASLRWPADLHVQVRQTPNLPPAQRSSSNGMNLLEIAAKDVQPLIAPKGAPQRFRIGRLAEATDFAAWSDLANLFIPLYREASTVPASGPLHDEVERIRAASTNAKTRAEQALALVQDRIRYVALVMGQGGYVPAPAETTWSRRFGDCKAKTALLLGILHSLGIQGEPVLVQARLGDMIADRSPMIALFNHVLVRAHVGGKDYWLDGTRTGDTDLDSIQVPDFDWGLPLVEHAQLVRMVPKPLDIPSLERHVAIDASAGVYAPATITIDEVSRGDSAVELNAGYSGLTTEQRDQQLHDEAKSFFDGFTSGSSSVQFDKAKREFRMTIKGTAKLNWKDSWFYVPTSVIAFDPDFDRAEGPFHDVPWAVAHPTFVKDEATIRLPHGVAAQQKLQSPVHETLAGVEYTRSETVNGDIVTVDSSERSVAPEVPYKDALAAEVRLRTLYNDDVYLRLTEGYRATVADLATQAAETPTSAQAFLNRGLLYLNSRKYDEAITDFTRAKELDPKNAWAIANRAICYAWKHEFTAARSDIAAAYAIDPANPVAARAEGFVGEQTGDYSGAISAYTKSLVRDPLNDFALTRRAFLYAGNWKYAEALADVSTILERNPKSAGALATRALIYAEKGDLAAAQRDFASASAIDAQDEQVQYVAATLAQLNRDSNGELAAFSKLLETTSNKAPIYAERAETYLKLNRYDEALADTNQALHLGGHDPDLRVVRANVFMIRGDRNAVATEAEAMIRENPGSAYALVAAAKTYAALGLRPKAMDAFNQALAIHPDPIVYINRAQVRPSTDIDGRIADLDAALKLEPDNVDALSEKARQLVLKGDYASALQLYDHAAMIDPDPENSAIPLGRALALYRSGQQQQASDLLRARRARAKSARDFNSLCWAEVSGNMFAEAGVADCHQALKLDPKSRHDDIALAMLRLNRLDDALAEFSAVIRQSHSAYGYFGRSITYLRKGKRAEAAADRAEALKLNPDEESRFAEYGLKP